MQAVQGVEQAGVLSNGMVWDDGSGPQSGQFLITRLSPEESARLNAAIAKAQPPAAPDDAPTPTRTSRQLVLDAASANPGASVRLMITVDGCQNELLRIREAPPDTSARVDAIQEREGCAYTVLAPAMAKTLELGATFQTVLWIGPTLVTEIPASSVSQIEDWPTDWKVEIDQQIQLEPNGAFTGVEVRTGMLLKQYHFFNYFGGAGNWINGPVRMGFYEDSQNLNRNHPGLAGRFMKYTRCYDVSSLLTCATYTPTAVASHGTEVASIALGTIEGGEDPNFPTQLDRERRSGIATQARGYYYSNVNSSTFSSTVSRVLQRAIDDGIDVLNHSYSWGAPLCTATDDTAIATHFANAQLAGVLNVMSAGNEEGSSGCSVRAPAAYRQGLVVGGLDSSVQGANAHQLAMYSDSARGGRSLKINGTTRNGVESLIDMVAPACFNGMYGSGGATTGTYHEKCGTSYAAPLVSGHVALAKNVWEVMNLPQIHNVNVIIGALLLQTDGWAGTTGGGTAATKTGFDVLSGAGRVHGWVPQFPSLMPPFAMGCAEIRLLTGMTYSYYPLGTNPDWQVKQKTDPAHTMMKAVMYFPVLDRSNASDVKFVAEDTCPPGAGAPVLIAQDLSYDTRKRIRLTTPDIRDKCVRLSITATHSPSFTPVVTCAYYHSGSITDDRH